MFVTVRVVVAVHEKVPIIPTRAVVYQLSKAHVYRLKGSMSVCKVRPPISFGQREKLMARRGGGGNRGKGARKGKGPSRLGKGARRRRRGGAGRGRGVRAPGVARAGGVEGSKGSKAAKAGAGRGAKPKGKCTVEKVFFTPGFRDADRVEVKSGLRPGDRIVVLGQQGLTDGAPVLVVGEK